MYNLSLALDLQSCGITSDSAQYMKEILKLNTVLTIVDMRANELIGEPLIQYLCVHMCM